MEARMKQRSVYFRPSSEPNVTVWVHGDESLGWYTRHTNYKEITLSSRVRLYRVFNKMGFTVGQYEWKDNRWEMLEVNE
jgi:hypothetical protein